MEWISFIDNNSDYGGGGSDNYYETVLWYAVKSGFVDLVAFLIVYDHKYYSGASDRSKTTFLNLIKRSGFDYNIRNKIKYILEIAGNDNFNGLIKRFCKFTLADWGNFFKDPQSNRFNNSRIAVFDELRNQIIEEVDKKMRREKLHVTGAVPISKKEQQETSRQVGPAANILADIHKITELPPHTASQLPVDDVATRIRSIRALAETGVSPLMPRPQPPPLLRPKSTTVLVSPALSAQPLQSRHNSFTASDSSYPVNLGQPPPLPLLPRPKSNAGPHQANFGQQPPPPPTPQPEHLRKTPSLDPHQGNGHIGIARVLTGQRFPRPPPPTSKRPIALKAESSEKPSSQQGIAMNPSQFRKTDGSWINSETGERLVNNPRNTQYYKDKNGYYYIEKSKRLFLLKDDTQHNPWRVVSVVLDKKGFPQPKWESEEEIKRKAEKNMGGSNKIKKFTIKKRKINKKTSRKKRNHSKPNKRKTYKKSINP